MKFLETGMLMVDYIIIKVIDTKKPEDGIQEIRYIDPMKMKFIRQEKKKNKNMGGVDLHKCIQRNVKKIYIQR